ncbi:hypothetical protein [Nocardia sputi]|uniref:hypothetical protein n=1 Tax=Nocardia sputi TaxID=2943705 RepID=UPI0020BE3B33|nr:hypothetical protein [Nocardia sputi]
MGARIGEYTLQRQKGGICYFGHARVQLVAGDQDVIWSVPPDDHTSLQPRHDAELIEAVLAGAQAGLEFVRSLAPASCQGRVEIVHARLQLTDIEKSAVHAAAALAVGQAFDVADRLELAFEDGWIVQVRPAGPSRYP